MLLSLVTFIPIVAALVVFCLPRDQVKLIKWFSMGAAILTFIVACQLVMDYRKSDTDTAERVLDDRVRTLVETFALPQTKAAVQDALTRIREDNAKTSGYAAPNRSPGEYAALANLDLGRLASSERKAFQECWELETAKGAVIAKNIKYVEYGNWIGAFNIRYFFGADGLSLPLIWLSALLGVLCLAYSWNITKATKAYFALFLLLEGALIGVFCALDFFLFYVFWEVVLLPMYFLIGIWGGPRRIYAAIKFFIYTLVGSMLMLLCMLVMYFHAGYDTFNVLTLLEVAPSFAHEMQKWLFLGLFVGFAIKVPVFPFHTWLPDAHVQAPTAASVILAGVLLKMGGYGFFRFSYGLAPAAATGKIEIPIFGNFVIFMAVLGVINIIYGALCAMAQKDFKSLVAYSSISHMGYVLLGLAALTDQGVQGAALQMFNHGLSSAMMFLLVGVLYDRAHHRNLDRFGGIGAQMPYYTGMATVGFFASLGLPGLNGFISEALVFMGAYDSHSAGVREGFFGLPLWAVYIALPGIVLTAAYILWTIQRVFMGEMKDPHYKEFPDVSFREWFAIVPLGILCIVFGVWPRLILDFMDGSLTGLVNMVLATTGK
jgi:NADH-quinone oxidoreductase subunit M